MADEGQSLEIAIRSLPSRTVLHRPSAYLNDHLEQDRRGINGGIYCISGSKGNATATASAPGMANSEISFVRVVVTIKPSPPSSRLHCARDACAALGITQSTWPSKVKAVERAFLGGKRGERQRSCFGPAGRAWFLAYDALVNQMELSIRARAGIEPA